MLCLSILDILIFIIINTRKIKLFREHLFSNAAKMMLFVSDAQHYVPVKLCKNVGSIHLFKITGRLTLKCKIKKKYTLGYYRIRLERSQHDF